MEKAAVKLTKKNGRNPCRTQPGEVRRVQYHEVYSSAHAADFANVPEATVYRAMRVGKLSADAGLTHRPRILHADLVAWMQDRGFPVPLDGGGPPPPSPDALVPLTDAAREAQVAPDELRAAIHARLVPASAQKRVRRRDLNAWIQAGCPLPAPLPVALGSRQVRLLERMLAGEVLRRNGWGWAIGDQGISDVTVRPLSQHDLIRPTQRTQASAITDAGLDALRACQTGRSVPTATERQLLRRLRDQGPLTRTPIDHATALPSEKRQLRLEESCLSRGWMIWREDALHLTDLGRRVIWRQQAP